MNRVLRLLALLLGLLLLIPALAEETPLPGYTLRESADEVRVFATRSEKAKIVGYIITGGRQEVGVLTDDGQWCYVRFTSIGGETFGYIPRSRFDVAPAATPAPTPAPSWKPGTRATVRNSHTGYRLNLRSGPAATYASTAKYYTGVDVTLTGGVRNGYAQVDVHGATGWMDLRFLETEGSVLIETPMARICNENSGANIRKGPGSSYGSIAWYLDGTQVTILGVTSNGWCHVEILDHYTHEYVRGYVAQSLLNEAEPFLTGTDSDGSGSTGIEAPSDARYVTTRSASGAVNLRTGASATSKSLGTFYTGAPAEVISYTRTGWCFVRIGRTTGYMDATYLTDQPPMTTGVAHRVSNRYATGVNLRGIPGETGELLSFLPNGETVTVLGHVSGGWSCILYGDGVAYALTDALRRVN